MTHTKDWRDSCVVNRYEEGVCVCFKKRSSLYLRKNGAWADGVIGDGLPDGWYKDMHDAYTALAAATNPEPAKPTASVPNPAALDDLYKACKRALDEMDGRPQGPGAVAILRNAIAKAEGNP